MDDKEYYSLMNRSSSWALQQALKKNANSKKNPTTVTGAHAQNAIDSSYKMLESRQGRADAEMLMEKQNNSSD